MINYEVEPQLQQMRDTMRRVSSSVRQMGSRRVIGPALRRQGRPGQEYLMRNTPRSRQAPRGRIRLAQSVRTTVGDVPSRDYTYLYTGWRTGRATGIHRNQTLAIEHGTRRTRATRVTARAFERTNPTDPTIVADAIQQDLNRNLRG